MREEGREVEIIEKLNCRAEMKHKLNPVLDAQLNRNRSRRHLGHRRNLSDGGHVGEDVSHSRLERNTK